MAKKKSERWRDDPVVSLEANSLVYRSGSDFPQVRLRNRRGRVLCSLVVQEKRRHGRIEKDVLIWDSKEHNGGQKYRNRELPRHVRGVYGQPPINYELSGQENVRLVENLRAGVPMYSMIDFGDGFQVRESKLAAVIEQICKTRVTEVTVNQLRVFIRRWDGM
ncbi:hypothetical protein MHW99_07175 [Corynebacterium sp. ACRPX]|uniref:hypothetical protein n=1 Tax=Corynebacterium sp. ACRPX TaxID=2918185 RepID=UPI001EF6690A|nr:hypothetical protein [Corynebacterium sp. ACRPX]MCG7245616.1 hypothetical protein [Corynebacterium sp. ACRPX]